jgi:polyhydroxybutyrate depolymerase
MHRSLPVTLIAAVCGLAAGACDGGQETSGEDATGAGAGGGTGAASGTGTTGSGAAGGGGGSTGGAGGSTGVSAGGSGGSTGTTTGTPDPNAPKPSAGCGKPATTGFFQASTSMPVKGAARAYWVAAPDGLPDSTPQKVVFVWHGCGGSPADVRKWLNVEDAARKAGDQAVFVYAQIGTSSDPGAGEGCFDGDGDQLYFLQALADVEATFCIDENKVFSTGYSSGGILSELIGCFHSDVVRAIAPVEGGLPSGQASCPGKLDAFVIHSPFDEQIGWNTPAMQTPHSWADGRGAVPLGFFYANDGCSAPPFDPGDTTIGQTDFTCATSPDGVHPYRVSRWLHDYKVPWATDTPHHWFPPEAPAAIWQFIAATP